MKQGNGSRIVFILGLVATLWALDLFPGSRWLLPIAWSLALLLLVRARWLWIAPLISILLIVLVEIGKQYGAIGDPSLETLVLRLDSPRQLALLVFMYVPLLAFSMSMEPYRLAQQLAQTILWKCRFVRRLCLLLVFIISLKENGIRQYQQLQEILTIRGERYSQTRLPALVTAFQWAPVLVRLMISSALERGAIHSDLNLRLGSWQPTMLHERPATVDRALMSLGLMGIFVSIILMAHPWQY